MGKCCQRGVFPKVCWSNLRSIEMMIQKSNKSLVVKSTRIPKGWWIFPQPSDNNVKWLKWVQCFTETNGNQQKHVWNHHLKPNFENWRSSVLLTSDLVFVDPWPKVHFEALGLRKLRVPNFQRFLVRQMGNQASGFWVSEFVGSSQLASG